MYLFDIPDKFEFDFNKVWNSQSIRDDFQNCLLDLVLEIYEIIIKPPYDQNQIPTEFAKSEKCWEIVKDKKFNWNKSLGYYLLSREDMRKIETSSRKEKRLTNNLETEVIIAKTDAKFWSKLDDWIFQNSSIMRISGTESKLLKDSRGIPNRFFPNTFQCKRLINIYERAKEQGFPDSIKID